MMDISLMAEFVKETFVAIIKWILYICGTLFILRLIIKYCRNDNLEHNQNVNANNTGHGQNQRRRYRPRFRHHQHHHYPGHAQETNICADIFTVILFFVVIVLYANYYRTYHSTTY